MKRQRRIRWACGLLVEVRIDPNNPKKLQYRDRAYRPWRSAGTIAHAIAFAFGANPRPYNRDGVSGFKTPGGNFYLARNDFYGSFVDHARKATKRALKQLDLI